VAQLIDVVSGAVANGATHARRRGTRTGGVRSSATGRRLEDRTQAIDLFRRRSDGARGGACVDGKQVATRVLKREQLVREWKQRGGLSALLLLPIEQRDLVLEIIVE